MSKNITDLNYDSKLSIDDLIFKSDADEKALLDRTQLVFGGFSLKTDARYGIVDLLNPRSVVSSETTRPLLVYVSENNPICINITPGLAVCPNGTMVSLDASIEDLELVRTLANDVIVLFIENQIVEDDPTRITRFNVPQAVRRVQVQNATNLAVRSSQIKSVLLSDYQNVILFPPERKANIVSLAVITVAESNSGLELQIDYSSDYYTFNRPWYSPVDVEHRSYIGSGVVSEKNPHALAYNDLSSGLLSLYHQILPTGTIQSRDVEYKGYVGQMCDETITPARVLTDTSGTITAAASIGGANAKYIVLASYPVMMASFYLNAHKSRQIAYEWIPGTRILVIPSYESLPTTATLQYTRVKAAEPPATVISNRVTFGQPDQTRELMYAGGLSVDTLIEPTIDFDGSGPYPRKFSVYVTGQGRLIRTPQVIVRTSLLDDVGTGYVSNTQSMLGPARVGIGLADANPVSSMSVVIRIYGKDINNNTINEDLTFSGSTWTAPVIPGPEVATQFVQTTGIFYSVTGFQVLSRTDDGPSARIQIYAELETGTWAELNDYVYIADVMWDGLGISSIKDRRLITTNVGRPLNRFEGSARLRGMAKSGGESHLASEDLLVPNKYCTIKQYQGATNSSYTLNIDDYSLFTNGDTLTVKDGVILTAVSGSPNRALGEFRFGTSNTVTRDDLMATINDTVLGTGLVATASGLEGILVTHTLVGALGNQEVDLVAVNPTALSISGIDNFSGHSIGGNDAFGEIYWPRQINIIDTIVPSSGTYDVSGIRGRYLSKTLLVHNKRTIRVVTYGDDPSKVQVRMRFGLIDDPNYWTIWQVASGNGFEFQVAKTVDIYKVQIEIFGRIEGFSVFEE